MADLIFILFVFALGACVGSFLNVVVWRLPRNESIVSPPSRCPYCEHRLAWFDNIPVIGWLALRGRCRYCHNPISAEYPTIEFITGALFVLFYVAFFIAHEGFCWIDIRWVSGEGWVTQRFMLESIVRDWPLYALSVVTASALLAVSLIDARSFFIPISIPIMLAVVGLLYHTILDIPRAPGSLTQENPVIAAMAIGAGIGLVGSILMLWRGIIPRSFPDGLPLLEHEKESAPPDKPSLLGRWISSRIEAFRRPLSPQQRLTMEQYRAAAEARERKLEEELARQIQPTAPPKEFTRADLRREMQREIIFLLPPLLLGFVCAVIALKAPGLQDSLRRMLLQSHMLSGFSGSVLGALVGALTIWLIRILGTLAFGREAMGMGDVHLMFGVGAIIGAAGSVVVFFLAPFVGLAFALYKLLIKGGREVPYGPFLSVATVLFMVFYCRIMSHFATNMAEFVLVVRERFMGQ